MIYDATNSIGFIIARTQGRIRTIMTQQFKEWDITPGQWTIINYLSKDNGFSPTEISEITFNDIPNTIRILQKLEKKGLVFRQIKSEDKRVSLYFLTDQGASLRDVLFPIGTQAMKQAVKGISPSKVEELKVLLKNIYANLS